MTEYTKSRKVLELEAKQRDVAIEGHFARQVQAMSTNPEGEPLIGASAFIKLAEETLDRVSGRIERLQRDIDAERALFDTDRKRLQRAFRALRKAGFDAVLGETPYESTNDSKLKVDPDAPDAAYAFAYANQLKYVFAENHRTWKERTTDTLQTSLYIHWGNNGRKERAEAIIEALQAEGLRTKWDGTGSDCVEVFSATDKEEVAA